MTPTSRAMRQVEPYPFEELDRARARAAEDGVSLVDFGVGDPRDATPELVRNAMIEALDPVSSYPRAAGLPELRGAIAAWVHRRFGVAIDPDAELLPTLGSKELIFSLAQLFVDPTGGKDLVAVTAPGYTIPERGARWAGADVIRLPLQRDRGFLPDLDAVDADTWRRLALVWVNYPNNPTGASAPPAFYRRLAELARRHDFVLASDEAYSELYFDIEPPASALQVRDRSNLLVVNTLSKRSSMTGYRSGFVAGDAELISSLRRLRPSTGVTPQEFVQRGSVAAWNDEAHVEVVRRGYARKRRLFLDLFERAGVAVEGSVATFYLWVRVPGREPSTSFATRLLRGGIVVAPGAYFGPEGEGYVRMAMVPSLDDCRSAVGVLQGLLRDVRV
jgi:succinyldiaminopimelate transaminase